MSVARRMLKDRLFMGWVLAEVVLFATGQIVAGFVLSLGFIVWSLAHNAGYEKGLEVGYRNHMRSIDVILAERERQIMELTAPDDPARQIVAQQRAQVQRALHDGLRAPPRPDDDDA
jgi:hypothetical protein